VESRTDLRNLNETELKCNKNYSCSNTYIDPYEILNDETELLEFGCFVEIPGINSISFYFSQEDMKTIIEDVKENKDRLIENQIYYPITRFFNKLLFEVNTYNSTRVRYSNDSSFNDAEQILN